MTEQVTTVKTADAIAQQLHNLVRKNQTRKQVTTAVLKLQASIKAICPQCEHSWHFVPFVRADVVRFYVLARRSSLATLRRRLVDHLVSVPLACPNCTFGDTQDRRVEPAVMA